MAMARSGDLIIPILGTPAAVGLARTLADARLRKWDYFHLIDDALLIISELVTNATRQTPNEEIRFRLSRESSGALIAVWDSSPAVPAPKPAFELSLDDLECSEENYDANGGWGLCIVQTLAARCGLTRDPGGGKWIWARLDC
ncbi:ATP-binding protein [Spirillospora albida]|uniref:ATP-binding protein n=1 Tax=Spirillospora albida TaxID=58123 RepID=UPI0012F821A7|nr:ATP-binding protein [Spirillospora albida]